MTWKMLLMIVWMTAIAACATVTGRVQATSSTAPAKSAIKIVIVGDSTVANYALTVPDRGWGQFIGEYFDPSVTTVNTAKNGRSTKTFISEGLWKKALEEKPDYVLIQFGHNDSHAPTQPESTNAATDFRQYLRQYIQDSRNAGAIPVLITPVQRRTYITASGATGGTAAAGEPGKAPKLDNTLRPYADAMKAVAAELKVPVIDLNQTSGELYEQLGAQANATVSRNGTDNTHFNERGARWMAALVMRDLIIAQPELAARLKPGTLSEIQKGPVVSTK